jgi:hypothetical protein
MRAISKLILVVIGIVALMFAARSCDDKDPYSMGIHWDYSIECEGGFTYKILGQKRGTILLLNSDGTPLKCGHKRY